MDISKIGQFDFPTQAFGKVRCLPLKTRIMMSMLTPTNLDLPSVDFVRKLISKMAVNNEFDEKIKDADQGVFLSNQTEIDKISDEELEGFAEVFLKNNQWMLEKEDQEKLEKTENTNGEFVLKKKGDLEHIEKPADQSYCDFLKMVFSRYLETTKKRNQKILNPLKSFFDPSPFSNTTQELIRQNSISSKILGGELSKLTDSLMHPRLDSGSDVVMAKKVEPPRMPIYQPPENPAYETNRKLNKLLQQVEATLPVITESADHIRRMNDASMQMIGEFGANAKKTTIFTYVMIFIATLTLFVTALFSWWSYQNTVETNQMARDKAKIEQAETHKLLNDQNAKFEKLLQNQNAVNDMSSAALISELDRIFNTIEQNTAKRSEEETERLLAAIQKFVLESQKAETSNITTNKGIKTPN